VPEDHGQVQDHGQDNEEQAVARVDQAVQLLTALDEAPESDQPQQDVLSRCAELILGAIEGCAAVSITVIDDAGAASTVASTAQWATDLDQEQYRLDDGPCMEAAREQIVQRVDYGSATNRWPSFVEASVAVGVGSYLSAGLRLDERQVASVNLYGSGPSAFDALDEALTALVTRYTSLALTSALRLGDARRLAGQLEQALHTRPVIDWAVGILMAQTPCTPERAFEMLRIASQRSNVKLRDVAAQIVERTVQRSQGVGEQKAVRE
jgi:ANTAR domain/GAF domain